MTSAIEKLIPAVGVIISNIFITHIDTNTAKPSHTHISNCREAVPRNSISSVSALRTEHFSLQVQCSLKLL